MAASDAETPEANVPEHEQGGPLSEGRVLDEIDEAECLTLLAGQTLGRLAVVREGQPDIFPVNYALDGRTITIKTQPGVKLTYAPLSRVAFEVEDIDAEGREGWVVVVHGIAEDITEAIDSWSEHARNAGASPWLDGPHEHHLAITRPEFSGRRLRHTPGGPAAS
jgi:nitroimidazol reductase NimA-like FMN-containing flavoprotein (pyridoxamine 5'-phosphate oxidase superfamily)